MSRRTCAGDLATRSFRRIEETDTVRTAISLFVSSLDARALLVVREDGSFGGLLTPRGLLRSLFSGWTPERSAEDDRSAEERLLDGARERLDAPVADLLERDVPVAAPSDSLVRLMELTADRRVYCVPVAEDGRVIGVVWLDDVFRAASGLALAATQAGPG